MSKEKTFLRTDLKGMGKLSTAFGLLKQFLENHRTGVRKKVFFIGLILMGNPSLDLIRNQGIVTFSRRNTNSDVLPNGQRVVLSVVLTKVLHCWQMI